MAKRNCQLLIAQHSSGKMIDVADAKNGLSCDCICVCCGSRLVARQGDDRKSHFAHESGAECAGAVESALHKVAKQIIENARAICIGQYNLMSTVKSDVYRLQRTGKASYNPLDPNTDLVSVFSQFVDKELIDRFIISRNRCQKSELKLESIEKEVNAKDSNRRPDITCKFKGKPLYIEIVVSNQCDKDKIDALLQLKVPTIEIDLSVMRKRDFKIADVESALLNSENHSIKRNWLVKPKYIIEAEECAREFINSAINRIEELEKDEKAKQVAIAARKTKVKALGTTIVLRETDYGLTVWIADVEKVIYDDLNSILIKLKARRRQNDWVLTCRDPKKALQEALDTHEKQALKKISDLVIQKESDRQKELAEDRVNRAEAERKYNLAAEKRKVLEQAERVAEQNKWDEESRIAKAEAAAYDAKRKADEAALRAEYAHVKDYRWLQKLIKEGMIARGHRV